MRASSAAALTPLTDFTTDFTADIVQATRLQVAGLRRLRVSSKRRSSSQPLLLLLTQILDSQKRSLPLSQALSEALSQALSEALSRISLRTA